MKHSELMRALQETFGSAYGRSLLRDLVLPSLTGRSPAQALDQGVDPQLVWDAICTEMELDEKVRWRHRGTMDPPRT